MPHLFYFRTQKRHIERLRDYGVFKTQNPLSLGSIVLSICFLLFSCQNGTTEEPLTTVPETTITQTEQTTAETELTTEEETTTEATTANEVIANITTTTQVEQTTEEVTLATEETMVEEEQATETTTTNEALANATTVTTTTTQTNAQPTTRTATQPIETPPTTMTRPTPSVPFVFNFPPGTSEATKYNTELLYVFFHDINERTTPLHMYSFVLVMSYFEIGKIVDVSGPKQIYNSTSLITEFRDENSNQSIPSAFLPIWLSIWAR